jgi:hypothetical protein
MSAAPPRVGPIQTIKWGQIKLSKLGCHDSQMQGSQTYARYKLATMLRNPAESNRTDSDFVEAEWQVFAGDPQETLHALEIMASQHGTESLKIAINPAYDSLAASPDSRNLQYKVKMNQIHPNDGFPG